MDSAAQSKRFTLQPGRWIAMDLWLKGIEHSSPIRIESVKPLGTGRSEIEVAFFHACYPEGLQNKVYRLRILHRTEHDLLAVCTDVADRRSLRLAPITHDWLSRQTHAPALAALANGSDEDFDSQLDRITCGCVSPGPAVASNLPDEVHETMMHCALRFDGYAWRDSGGPEREQESSQPATDRLLRELILDSDPEINFANCFFLQRFLYKWGGEMLPENDPHHTAYRFLFLHLHTTPTPERWVHREREAAWQNTPLQRIERHAAQIRRTLAGS